MDKFIKRDLLVELKSHLKQKEVSLIIGPRQAGKTTLMLFLEQKLRQEGVPSLFFNLDREIDKSYFKTQEGLTQKIHLEIGSQKGFVFIDEIQRKENAGLFLKGIYDSNLPYKFIVSGSGSLELKEKIHESLVGRKRIFELGTVSFEEFVHFKTKYRYKGGLAEFFEVEEKKREFLLNEYLNFGGYPRVILSETEKEKRIVIDEIFQSYLEKDISYLLRVEKIDSVFHLIRILSAQVGQLINFSKLTSELNISFKTLKNYLWYAEKTFILKKLTPYFKNVKKEIVKSPCYYFYDLGLRNYAMGSFGNLMDFGPPFENLVLNILRERLRWTGATIHFWRTKDRAEVDFVIDYGKDILPIEVKYKMFKSPTIFRSMRNFIKRYSPRKALIINLNLRDSVILGETEVIFLPYWELLKKRELGLHI